MSPRRHLLPLLSALALLLTPFALAPRGAQAATVDILVDTLGDAAPTGTSCATLELADGDCSLRQAIAKANSLAAGDVKNISFELFTGGTLAITGPVVLTTASNLPTVTTSNVQIVADLGVDGLPRIEIDGNGKAVGFQISGDNNLIKGLSLYGFTNSGIEPFFGSAIYITGDNNDVQTCFVGIRPDGTVPAGKANFSGIRIDGGGTGNVIGGAGGTVVANYISGNTQNGVIVRNSSGNFIQNNVIGLVRSGSTLTLLGNGQYGVQVTSINGTSANNSIGGTTSALANIIGGNGQAGIYLRGTGTTTTTILANYVGIDKTTDSDFGNTGDGVLIEAGSSGNTLAGTGSAPLVISGNSGYGVLIRSADDGVPVGNRISGTVFVGTNRAGTAALPNSAGGVLIANEARNTEIDGAGGSVRVAGNGGPGITIRDEATTGTRIQSALVGLVPISGANSPSQAVANAGGIVVEDARGTTLAGNTISGNSAYGVRLSGTEAVTVTGNFVGLSLNRKAVQGNGGPGIQLWNAPNTLIGGGSSTTNYIAGNTGPGVVISGTNSLSVAVRTNLIGLVQEAATTNYLGRGANAGEGVLVTGGARDISISGNTIAASADSTATDFAGVSVLGDGSAGLSATNVATVTVSSNRIGWLPQSQGSSVQVPFPNGDGVVVAGGVQGVAILTNTIRLNVGAAIRLTDALTPTVRGNQIQRNAAAGVVAGGDTPGLRIERNAILESGRNSLGAVVNPAADGILLSGDEGIAGTQILSNTVRANTGRAIALEGDVNRATMRFNLLALNGDAIRLVGSTIFDGTPPDPDTQATPNRGIDPPIVDLSFTNPLGIRVNQAGFVDGYVYTNTSSVQPITEASLAPISACVTCTIQIFRPDRAAPADAQGGELIFTIPESGGTTPRDTIPVAANGRFSARIQDTLPERLLFIATDGFGNSSEYAVFPLTAGVVLEPVSPLAVNAAPGDTVTYTLRLRNTGTLAYTNLNLATSGTLAGWDLVTEPFTNTAFSLAGGASRLITATLTLPTGSDPNVAAGTVDSTTLTITGGPPAVNASATLQTTVLPRPVIAIEPRSSLGSGRPTTPVPHAFAITNNGNVTVTLDLDYTTVDPALSPGVWATSINTTTLTLGPGADARVGLSVTVPQGALQNASATTYLTATVRPGTSPVFPGQTVPFSATTRAELNPNADLFPDVEARASAGGSVALTHNVVNRSNGTATFCLDYFSASQSTARFEPATSGFVIDARGCFTLYAAADVDPGQGRFNEAQLRAVVTVDDRLTTGDIETVTIFLRQGSPTGESISDATVEDKIIVIAGQKIPRLWMPLLRR